MTEQQIIDNAPEGWTHVDEQGTYWNILSNGDSLEWTRRVGGGWFWNFESLYIGSLRARQDIERIAHLAAVLNGEHPWEGDK